MEEAPSGTVTLLFTDVEGSTRLWEDEPKAMTTALRRHDEIIRAVIEGQSGYVFKTVGDAFCAAFATPQAALSATLVAQQQLVSESWPTGRPIRVRMALHTGVCEERDNDYFGPAVNRTARLEAIAHGGQVVVSGTTADLLSGSLPDGIKLRDLGQHRLKDLGRPEQVFQLEAEMLPSGFPPLVSLDNPELPNNLPSLLSAFVGREPELTEIGQLLTSSRLVTLTGAGGCGKTRLALHAAAELLEGTAEGVWFVDLAPVTDAGQVLAAVAGVLGVPAQGGQPLPDALMAALREQAALLLLDNCEHVIDEAAAFCSQVVRNCPRVRILATSREPLGVDGERVYRVASLSLPPPEAESAEDLAASDAVRLFAERARAQDQGFALDDAVAPLVASVCRRLDGIPLALELAAARLSSMSLTQLSDRLDQRFRLLTGGSRNVMPRQQTLQATVDWSFSLLDRARAGDTTAAGGLRGRVRAGGRRGGLRDRSGRRLRGHGPGQLAGRQEPRGRPTARQPRCATGCWRRSGSTAPRNCCGPAVRPRCSGSGMRTPPTTSSSRRRRRWPWPAPGRASGCGGWTPNGRTTARPRPTWKPRGGRRTSCGSASGWSGSPSAGATPRWSPGCAGPSARRRPHPTG